MRDTDKQMLADRYLDLYRTAYSILHNKTDVEDAVQEALAITMSRTLLGNPYSYCVSVLKNICIKMMLQKEEVLFDNMPDIAEPETENQRLRTEIISNLWDQLPERICQIFQLYYEKGYSKTKIAHEIGISESMVKKLFNRGHNRIRKELIDNRNNYIDIFKI